MGRKEHRALAAKRRKSTKTEQRGAGEFSLKSTHPQETRAPSLAASASLLGLGSVAFDRAGGFSLIQKDKSALLVAHHDVGEASVLDVAGDDLGADAGVGVNQVRDEINLAIGRALHLKPI